MTEKNHKKAGEGRRMGKGGLSPVDPKTNGQLDATLAKLQRSIAEREAAHQYQFPLWPEPQRGFPNSVVRSALFPAVRVRGEKALRDVPIASQKGYTITYTGMPLTQADGDVYEAIMHMARGQPEGNRVLFSRYSLLRLMGRSTGSTDHERLLQSLKCMSASAVQIDTVGENGKRRLYWGSLLPSGAFDEESGLFSVQINRDLAKFFERDFTLVEWEERRALARKPLARWLHGYYSSHARPHNVTVALLAKLSGSKTENLRAFRQNVKAALQELVRIGFLRSYHITPADHVHVERADKALPA